MSRGRVAAPHQEADGQRGPRAGTTTLEDAGTTPILREYRAVKREHPDAIVLARLGDFFELFGDDAEIAAPLLGVTLTGRGFGGAGRLPMCGVPAHAIGQYIGRLLRAGHRVALWDQIEGPEEARGRAADQDGGRLVRRAVTRVLTPGTVVDDDLLEAAVTVRCVAIAARSDRVGIAALDVGGGELQLAELPGGFSQPALADELERLAAAELVIPEDIDVPGHLAPRASRTRVPAANFSARRGVERLREAAGTASLRGLDIEDLDVAHAAAAALLGYCERNRVAVPSGSLRVRARPLGSTMRLDAPTRRNLELAGGTGTGALVALLDATRTPMGARLLRTRVLEPLIDVPAIEGRLDLVGWLVEDRDMRARLRAVLARTGDLERLTGRCVQAIASPRDLAAIGCSIETLTGIADLFPPGGPGTGLAGGLRAAPIEVGECLRAAIVDDPPATARDGGCIRAGQDAELDALRGAGAGARTYIASLEERERAATGIRSLKVGYNRVFGYYLEVPNAHRDLVPATWHRKQTLVGAERFITPQLKEHETVVLRARERSAAREVEILAELRTLVASNAPALLGAATAVAELDVAHALAMRADELAWCRPEVDNSLDLVVEASRHPVVEAALPAGAFVPNDCALGARGGDGGAQVMVITGPNMAGKSTYLRQTALCVLLAQMGSYVPATSARIGVCDRIFTRVGAHDDLAGGLSTFMVEMTETAAILGGATTRSLVVLDEIGRGTSTYDGLAIAQAVVEYLHDAPHLGCRTLFATHFHELTALASHLGRVRNARVEVVEEGDHITFLHRIVEGGADRSYGLHVARLAGIPADVIGRARHLLTDLETLRPAASGVHGRVQLALPLGGDSSLVQPR